MAMRDEVTAILAAADVPKEFTEYLVNKGLFQVDQLALMALMASVCQARHVHHGDLSLLASAA